MRVFRIDVFFPEVKPAHAAQQGVTAAASSMGRAIRDGLQEIVAREDIRGKRISIAKLTVVEIKGGKPETIAVTKGAA